MPKFFTACSSATPIAGLSMVFAIVASAEPVFHWKDSQGNPVFSDRAPTPNQPFVIIGHWPHKAAAEFTSDRSSTRHNPQDQHNPQNLQPAILGKIGSDAEQQSLGEACDQARTTQNALSASGRVFWRGEDGSRVWLDATTRATQGALAEEIIRLACRAH